MPHLLKSVALGVLSLTLFIIPGMTHALTPVISTPKPSPIKVLVPNGGEKWELGVTNSVTWSPYGYNPDVNPSKDVSAYLETRNEKGTFTTLGRVEESGKASIHWITGDLNSQNGTFSQVAPGSYYIRIVNNKTGDTDRSDAPFTILPRPVDVKVNGSDGPVSLTNNQKVKVSWSSTGGRNTCELSGVRKTPTGNNYIEDLAGSGSLELYAAVSSNYANAIELRCSKNNESITAVYDIVSVNVKNSASSVRVITPNGGEVIDAAKEMKLKFTAAGIKTYSAALYKNDQFKYWIAKDQVASGTNIGKSWYPAKVLEGLGEGDNAGAIYKIYVTAQKSDGTGYVDDKSDKPFSFVGTPAKPLITFTSSQGGSASSPTTTLTWVVANATRCYLSYGSTQTEVPFIGNQVVYPEQTTTYTLRCGNEQNGKDGPVTEQSIVVKVLNKNPKPTCALTTNKKTYLPGENVVLAWTSTGASYAAWDMNGSAKALGLPGDKLSDFGTTTVAMASSTSKLVVTLNVYSKTGVKSSCRATLMTTLSDRSSLTASAYAAIEAKLQELLAKVKMLGL